MFKKISLLLICCLLLLQVGCGGSKKSGEADGKPWHLFTEDEAEELLGFEVEPEIDKIDSAGQRLVFYGPKEEKETDFIQISVVRSEDMEDSLKEQGYNAKQLFEDAKNNADEPPKPVEGIGDAAFWSGGALNILAGEVCVTISTGHEDKPEYLERAKVIAKTVMSRL